VDGARWVQQDILAANPRAALRVYALWFDNFEGDERDLVDHRLLADARVTQFWDEQKHAGRWYARTFTRPEDPDWVEWDAFFVYAPGDTWEQAGARPVRWGRTIIGKREDLRAAVAALLE
jgi:hypothetical protein